MFTSTKFMTFDDFANHHKTLVKHHFGASGNVGRIAIQNLRNSDDSEAIFAKWHQNDPKSIMFTSTN